MATLPGVQAVAATDDPELADNNHGGNVTVEGYNAPPDEDFDVEALGQRGFLSRDAGAVGGGAQLHRR